MVSCIFTLCVEFSLLQAVDEIVDFRDVDITDVDGTACLKVIAADQKK